MAGGVVIEKLANGGVEDFPEFGYQVKAANTVGRVAQAANSNAVSLFSFGERYGAT